MKGIKIGQLLITWKAFYLILFALFIDGMIIGAAVASNQMTKDNLNVLVILVLLLLPFVLLLKTILKNIHNDN